MYTINLLIIPIIFVCTCDNLHCSSHMIVTAHTHTHIQAYKIEDSKAVANKCKM